MEFKENAKIGIGYLTEFGGVAEHIKNIIKHSKYNVVPVFSPQSSLVQKYTYLTIWTGLDPFGNIVVKKSGQFNIFHVHGSPYLARYVSKNKGKFSKKYIQTFHAIYFEDDYPNKKIWKFKEKENKILIESSRKADVIISVAKWLSELLKNQYNIESMYIPNGVNVRDFEKVDDNEIEYVKKKYGLPKEYFLFSGKLHKYKRPEMIIRIAQALPDKKFVMTGKNIDKKLLEVYMRERLPDNILTLGVIPRSDLISVMKLSKVFVLPSKNETFGIAILEAMAAKKVVVAANSAGPSEIIRNGIDGYLFEPDNINDLEEKVLKAWENPQLGENGYQHVKEEYDWRVIIKDIDKIYENLL